FACWLCSCARCSSWSQRLNMDFTKVLNITHKASVACDCWQRSEKYTSRIGATMSTVTITPPIHREPELLGQTVVVIGGLASRGMGLETARRARAEGAKVIRTGRNAERLQHAANEVDALSTAAFDAADPVALDRFFRYLPTIDHVMVTAGRPYYRRLADMDF